MIKIVVSKISSYEIIEKYISLCNLLNKENYKCTVYSQNPVFVNKCNFVDLKFFYPEENDIIILDNIALKYFNDLFNIRRIADPLFYRLQKNKPRYKFKRWSKIKKADFKAFLAPRKTKNFDLILSWQTLDENELKQTNLSLYDKIILSSSKQEKFISKKYNKFILPEFKKGIKPSITKSLKTAGVLNSISKDAGIEEAIKSAVDDGMNKIYLYGYISDPEYYYNNIRPIVSENTGKIQYCGRLSDIQKIYDSVSDVYDFSKYRVISNLELECNMSGTKLHTNKNLDISSKTSDEILSLLEQELKIEKYIKSEITVVLNGFRRGKNLDKQIEAIKNQSIKPDNIMLWYNDPGEDSEVNYGAVKQTLAAVSNENWGVWARFYYAMNAKTKYVCVFDDDTIPGPKWFENCLNTIKTHRGLLGTVGLVYDSKDDYFQNVRYGWVNPNEDIQEVDIVGHSWFFEKEFLTAFCRELPLLDVKICGEDIHFSYTLQKYFGLKTYVPPHPANDKSMWGSLKGNELGIDKHAISCQHIVNTNSNFMFGVNDYFKECLKNGWKLINFKGEN